MLNVKDEVTAFDPEIVVFDSFDDALIGVAKILRNGCMVNVAVYDRDLCIDVLMKQMKTDDSSESTSEPFIDALYEEAVEYIEFNLEGAYIGERTPIFLNSYQSRIGS